MSGHTDGPWRVSHGSYVSETGALDRMAVTKVGAGVVAYAYTNCTVTSESECRANALLIAAAPDLLAALQFVMTAHGEQLELAFDDAWNAIAKATGEMHEH